MGILAGKNGIIFLLLRQMIPLHITRRIFGNTIRKDCCCSIGNCISFLLFGQKPGQVVFPLGRLAGAVFRQVCIRHSETVVGRYIYFL